MKVFFGFPAVILLLFFLHLQIVAADPAVFPDGSFDVLRYDLSIKIGFEHSGYEISRNTLSGVAKISLKNTAPAAITQIPVLLHRLMKATSVQDGAGNVLPSAQTIQGMEGNETYQINYVQVSLKDPLQPGATASIEIRYEGHLAGYTETGMLYVRETLDPAFTIIRSETFAYPQVLYPAEKQRRLAYADVFDQSLHITVPEGYVAVNAGDGNMEKLPDGFVVYHFRNLLPKSTILVPIAKYQRIDSDSNRIYFFPEDRKGAESVAEYMSKAFALYTDWFGPLKVAKGITLTEIPSDFGSEADHPLILQTADAFQKSTELGQLYHEISHLWNPKDLETLSPRWNEGLAMFLQGIVGERLGQGPPTALTERLFTSFQKYLRDNPDARVAMKDYGVKDQTTLSYTGGAVFFSVVYDILGPESFLKMYRTFYDRYGESGANTEDFLNHLAAGHNPQIDRLIADWFQSAKYAEAVLSAGRYQDLLQHYRTK